MYAIRFSSGDKLSLVEYSIETILNGKKCILQMSENFNRELSLIGSIPSGMFNSMFEFSGCWQRDAANTKSLAFDGFFISLYTVALPPSRILLLDHVTKAVPSTWDPLALAR